MTQFEFGKACLPLNKKYKELFGIVPTPVDYICNRDQFLDALQKSVTEQKPLSEYLHTAPLPDMSRYEY